MPDVGAAVAGGQLAQLVEAREFGAEGIGLLAGGQGFGQSVQILVQGLLQVAPVGAAVLLPALAKAREQARTARRRALRADIATRTAKVAAFLPQPQPPQQTRGNAPIRTKPKLSLYKEDRRP